MQVPVRILFALLLFLAVPIAHGDDNTRYEALSIVAPLQDATVHDNQGRVDVAVRVSPPLRTAAGDRIALLLDGSVVANTAGTSARLANVDRGTHTLQAQVTAADGTVLLASAEIRFHMWRASRLFPNRKD